MYALCVEQFTLYAVLKGNKPDYHQTMAGDQSKDFYQRFLTRLRHCHQADLVNGTGCFVRLKFLLIVYVAIATYLLCTKFKIYLEFPCRFLMYHCRDL